MPTAAESQGNQSQIAAALGEGVELISQKQQIQFQRYSKVTLEQDGFVFWVATGEKMTVTGALHGATDRTQDEDQTIGVNHVIFTSETMVTRFDQISPQSMWIGRWELEQGTPPLLVAFSSQSSFFEQANIWHYMGFAVYPALRSQLVDSAADLPAGPIVSNSLPIWLTQTAFAGQTVPVYASYLVPDNVAPPYVAVHIQPELTESLAAAPSIIPPGVQQPNSGQAPFYNFPLSVFCRDTVRLTLYGFSNTMAWQYLWALYEASSDGTAPFGFANNPVPVDEKRTQPEISALAQKKTITILANYNQFAADAVARRYILSALMSYQIVGGITPIGSAAGTQAPQIGNAIGVVTE